MTEIIVMGHGAYAAGTKENVDMIVGVPENMRFLDLTREMDLADFETRLDELTDGMEGEILFVCDLMGASPFRTAAMKCAKNPDKYVTVTGVNTMGFMEMAMNGELPVSELADQVLKVCGESMVRFPEKAQL